MTRKCVICKETNYKNSFSFFSAPKDPEIRKKWHEAIAIDNYVVSDDTYVCSRHFTPSDIITHWISGVPPHVVTIKYKKCRLRPGAVPNNCTEALNYSAASQEDEYEALEVNRSSGPTTRLMRRPGQRETFSIPREETMMEVPSECAEEICETQDSASELKEDTGYMVLHEANDDSSLDTENSAINNGVEHEVEQQQEITSLVNLHEGNENFVYSRSDDGTEIVFFEASENTESLGCIEEEIELTSEKNLRRANYKGDMVNAEEENSMDMWESLSNENPAEEEDEEEAEEGEEEGNNTYRDITDEGKSDAGLFEIGDPLKINEKENNYEESECAMLFEDLLDVFTEVQLPDGWSSMVTSKGRSTTVLYTYMGVTLMSGMPFIEKQVFLRTDMKIRCGAANKELNPQLHNLIKDGRHRIVRSLADVEEFIEEFDQRIVCEGWSGETSRWEEIDNNVGYKDVSSKWRHVQCPIIVNNGTTRCSKCCTLSGTSGRGRLRRHHDELQHFQNALQRKEKTIRVLHRLLRKTNEKNQRFETMRDSVEGKFETMISESQKVFMATVEMLDMPKIQKIMVKECLRASSNAEPGKARYSETWVFLCLLLYIESPRMYKYMLLNKYMTLPTMRTIKRYLHQIKTDKQFYNLFQRVVAPFQSSDRENESEPT